MYLMTICKFFKQCNIHVPPMGVV